MGNWLFGEGDENVKVNGKKGAKLRKQTLELFQNPGKMHLGLAQHKTMRPHGMGMTCEAFHFSTSN